MIPFEEFVKTIPEHDPLEEYRKQLSYINNKTLLPMEVLDKYGLKLQHFTMVSKDGEAKLFSFIAGENLFIQLLFYNGDDNIYYLDENGTFFDAKDYEDGMSGPFPFCYYRYYNLHINDSGEIIIEENINDVEWEPHNFGKTSEQRDFREYPVLENIKWALTHGIIEQEGYDGLHCEQGGLGFDFDDTDALKFLLDNYRCDEEQYLEGILDI